MQDSAISLIMYLLLCLPGWIISNQLLFHGARLIIDDSIPKDSYFDAYFRAYLLTVLSVAVLSAQCQWMLRRTLRWQSLYKHAKFAAQGLPLVVKFMPLLDDVFHYFQEMLSDEIFLAVGSKVYLVIRTIGLVSETTYNHVVSLASVAGTSSVATVVSVSNIVVDVYYNPSTVPILAMVVFSIFHLGRLFFLVSVAVFQNIFSNLEIDWVPEGMAWGPFVAQTVRISEEMAQTTVHDNAQELRLEVKYLDRSLTAHVEDQPEFKPLDCQIVSKNDDHRPFSIGYKGEHSLNRAPVHFPNLCSTMPERPKDSIGHVNGNWEIVSKDDTRAANVEDKSEDSEDHAPVLSQALRSSMTQGQENSIGEEIDNRPFVSTDAARAVNVEDKGEDSVEPAFFVSQAPRSSKLQGVGDSVGEEIDNSPVVLTDDSRPVDVEDNSEDNRDHDPVVSQSPACSMPKGQEDSIGEDIDNKAIISADDFRPVNFRDKSKDSVDPAPALSQAPGSTAPEGTGDDIFDPIDKESNDGWGSSDKEEEWMRIEISSLETRLDSLRDEVERRGVPTGSAPTPWMQGLLTWSMRERS